jgi:Flp pilus assembly protein TadB
MNGENNHIFHTSALDGATEPSQAAKIGSPLVAGQSWLLAAFVALSLTAIGVETFITGEQPLVLSAVLTLAGLVLFPVMLHNVARAMERAEPEAEMPAPLAPELRFALHR